MKTGLTKSILTTVFMPAFGAMLTMVSVPAVSQISASIEINSRADFEAPLAAEGTWVDDGRYGRCWHPRGVAEDWRPYCNGQWVWTDCGWYWESDEPWAWACYHYGSWMDDPSAGWVWVPDVEWAPAWVDWRVGDDYIGWAPCAPPGLSVAPGLFAFVGLGHFHDPVRRADVVFNNPTILGRTSLRADFKHETRTIDGRQRRVAINDGPGVGTIEKATGRKETATPVQDVIRNRPAVRDVKPTERTTEPRPEQRPQTRPETRPETRPATRPETRPEQRPTLPDKQDRPDTTTRPRETTPANREPATRPVQPAQPPVQRPVTPPSQERHITPVSPRQPNVSPWRPVTPPQPRQPAPTPEPAKPVTPPRENKPETVPHEEKPAAQPGGNDKDKGRRDGGGQLSACRPSTRIEIV